jgi:hypothetical protein
MQPPIDLLFPSCCALFFGTILSGQSAKLPADVDPNTLSRLPLVLRSSRDANGQRIYDFMNQGSPSPRLGDRKYTAWLNHSVGSPITSLEYFAAILSEVEHATASPDYWGYLARKVEKLESDFRRRRYATLTSTPETK